MFFQPILGIILIILFAYICSSNKNMINWMRILLGISFSFILLLLLTKLEIIIEMLSSFNAVVSVIDQASTHASSFMFGYLGGGKAPFDIIDPSSNFVIAFRVLPLIIVVSALSSLFFYLGIIPLLIRLLASIFQKVFRVSGPLGFGSVSSIFLGTIETPLIIKPYLSKMNDAEILALLSCTMATVSGSVMFLYSSVLSSIIQNPMSHMIVASVVSVPIALTISMIIMPLPEDSQSTSSKIIIEKEQNAMEALLKGTFDGLQMVISIVGVIIVLFALVFIVNKGLALLPLGENISLSIQSILGFFLRPVMWLTGISWAETAYASDLMSTKIIMNEFVAFMNMSTDGSVLSERSKIILIYSLCGFANLGSLGIVTGGLKEILAGDSSRIYSIALKALIIGNMTTLVTGCLVALTL